MPVRGSTHARVQKRAINLDRGGTPVGCANIMPCDRDGYELYKIIQHEHARSIPCDHELARHATFIFCSERCKQYFLACSGPMAHDTAARNRGRIAGMLPPGYRASL